MQYKIFWRLIFTGNTSKVIIQKSMKQERANTYLCAAHLDFPGNETEKEHKLEKRV